jgi:homospermidine synthase
MDAERRAETGFPDHPCRVDLDRQPADAGYPVRPQQRPAVHCAHQSCDDAVLSLHELAGRRWRKRDRSHVLKDEIVFGSDEFGVLRMGHARGAYWCGSPLGIEPARALCPHDSATGLQVAAPAMAGAVWAPRNPARDTVEPDDLSHDGIQRPCRPCLGDVVGVVSDWTPLAGRDWPFEEDIDRQDPRQFKNIRVV